MNPPDTDAEIRQRVAHVRERIEAAARRAGRQAADVTLVGVTKRQPLERVAAVVRAGVQTLGENYIQEARDKQPRLAALLEESGTPPPRWRMIGRLQRNKARLAAELFEAVETLDRSELADALDRHAGAADRVLDALIQVNLSAESQKGGVTEAALPELLAACDGLEHLRVVGLMTLPAFGTTPEASRPAFAQLRELAERLKSAPGGSALEQLSMGMSADFEVAIEEGATLVRVGTALLGERASS